MIELLLTLAVFGFIIWLITQIPMPGIMQQVIIGVAVLAIVIWVLEGFGATHFGYFGSHSFIVR